MAAAADWTRRHVGIVCHVVWEKFVGAGTLRRIVADARIAVEQFLRLADWQSDYASIRKCASVGFPARPLIGRMSCGQAENAMTRSISARSLM